MAKGDDNKRILIIGNCYYSVFRFRKELIHFLVTEGYDVYAAFPDGEHEEKERGDETARLLGCRYLPISMERRSINLLNEALFLCYLYRIMCQVKPGVVLLFTVKPNIYGGIIAKIQKIPYIINVTGLGSAFNKNKIFVRVLSKVYVRCINQSLYTFYQNQRDCDYFKNCGANTTRFRVLPGSGVNLSEFHPLPYLDNNQTVFLYMSRIMKEKGIDEFLDAAEHFMNDEKVKFVICGDCEENYQLRLKTLESRNIVTYVGQVSDVVNMIGEADCIIHPSFYNEGVSNVLLEAAACGRIIITTDNIGCREVVDDGKSGYIVKSKDSKSLIEAVNKVIASSKEDRYKMGMAGRRKIEKEFDRRTVIGMYYDVIRSIF